MSNPKVTVYLVSHNYGRFLDDSIGSLYKQTFDDWEVLMINDNSSDDTKEKMEIYRGDEKVRIFHTDGIGLPAVANLALKEAKGEYIVRLDADDIFDENILLVLSNYLDRNPKEALVFPDYYLMDDHHGIIREEKRMSLYSGNQLLDIPAHGACTMIRKSVLEEIGGYRTDLGAQDGFDIWTKITKNYRCGNVNLPLFYYRRHGTNLTEDSDRIVNAKRRIKADGVLEEIKAFDSIISVIPVRKNYDIYEDLWDQKLDDKTLLEIAIETNLDSELFQKIVILSDTDEVKETMAKYNDDRLVYVGRPTKLTTPSSNIIDSLAIVHEELNIPENGITALSYIQAPFTTKHTFEEAIHTLIFNEADSAFSAKEVNSVLYKRSNTGFVPINKIGSFQSDFDIVYSLCGSSSAIMNANVSKGLLKGVKMVTFVVPEKETFFINSRNDFKIAQIKLEHL